MLKLEVIIAEKQYVLQAGLRAIFSEDSRVAKVHVVSNERDLTHWMLLHQVDLIVVNQSLIKDLNTFHAKNFVILSTELDIAMLKAAYRSGARGYLSANASIDLWRSTLQPQDNSFLMEPTLAPVLIEQLHETRHFICKESLLTPRENEVVLLLRRGMNRTCIARQMHISEMTLKTHISNIAKKTHMASSLSTE